MMALNLLQVSFIMDNLRSGALFSFQHFTETFKAGQLRSRFRIEIAAFFENKFMLPAVPEIIQITQCAAFLFEQISKTVFTANQPVFFRFRIFRVSFIPDGKFVQMAVGSAHDNLDNIV